MFYFNFSSPSRSPVLDSEIVMMNTLYKERFPKVKLQLNIYIYKHFIILYNVTTILHITILLFKNYLIRLHNKWRNV